MIEFVATLAAFAATAPIAAGQPCVTFLGTDRVEAVSFETGIGPPAIVGTRGDGRAGLRVACPRAEVEAQLALAFALTEAGTELDRLASLVARNLSVAAQLPGKTKYVQLVVVQAEGAAPPATLQLVPVTDATKGQHPKVLSDFSSETAEAFQKLFDGNRSLAQKQVADRGRREEGWTSPAYDKAAEAVAGTGALALLDRQYERQMSELSETLTANQRRLHSLDEAWSQDSHRYLDKAMGRYKDILAQLAVTQAKSSQNSSTGTRSPWTAKTSAPQSVASVQQSVVARQQGVAKPAVGSPPVPSPSGKRDYAFAMCETDTERCRRLAEEINQFVNRDKHVAGPGLHGLKHRFPEQIFGGNGPGTPKWETHERNIEQQRNGLRGRLEEFAARGCGDPPHGAWTWATRQVPKPEEHRGPSSLASRYEDWGTRVGLTAAGGYLLYRAVRFTPSIFFPPSAVPNALLP